MQLGREDCVELSHEDALKVIGGAWVAFAVRADLDNDVVTAEEGWTIASDSWLENRLDYDGRDADIAAVTGLIESQDNLDRTVGNSRRHWEALGEGDGPPCGAIVNP
jgi:hypothetical protein